MDFIQRIQVLLKIDRKQASNGLQTSVSDKLFSMKWCRPAWIDMPSFPTSSSETDDFLVAQRLHLALYDRCPGLSLTPFSCSPLLYRSFLLHALSSTISAFSSGFYRRQKLLGWNMTVEMRAFLFLARCCQPPDKWNGDIALKTNKEKVERETRRKKLMTWPNLSRGAFVDLSQSYPIWIGDTFASRWLAFLLIAMAVDGNPR